MRLHESYVFTCVCGQSGEYPLNCQPFICPSCGRHAVIDFRVGLTEKELLALLDTLDCRRDAVVKAIENRREAA
jgi:hypothetical protein